MKTSGSFKPGNRIGTVQQKRAAGRKGKLRSPWREDSKFSRAEREAHDRAIALRASLTGAGD